MKRKPLEKTNIGRITVLEYVRNKKYKCQCDCGTIFYAYASNLRRGHTKDCGCKGEIGKKYGKLTIAKRYWKGKYTYCDCVCDCGNRTTVRLDSLKRGNTHSCGCLEKERVLPQKILEDFKDGTQLSKLKSTPTKSNKSGVVGVNWDKSRNLWQASIRYKGKKIFIGRFANIEDATIARRKYEKMLFDPILKAYQTKDK